MTGDILVVRTQIKDIAGEFSVAKDFAEALDEKVLDIIQRAMLRARENGRTTLMPRDI